MISVLELFSFLYSKVINFDGINKFCLYFSCSSNLSRQSTQDSDSDTIASTGEPIKKSDREYIIPIAVEGGGYVTPRAGSLEPTESSATSGNRSRTKFGRARRLK